MLMPDRGLPCAHKPINAASAHVDRPLLDLIDALKTLSVCGWLPAYRAPACVMMLALALVPRWPVGQCCTEATAEPAVLEWRFVAVGRRLGRLPQW